jgi:hypothetical protein
MALSRTIGELHVRPDIVYATVRSGLVRVHDDLRHGYFRNHAEVPASVRW